MILAYLDQTYCLSQLGKELFHQALIQFCKYFYQFIKLTLNPISHEGGHYGPDDHKRPLWLFLQDKGYDHQNSWLCFCLCLNGPIKVIFQICFWNFWKKEIFFWQFQHQMVPPLEKNSKFSKNYLFSQEIILFLFEFALYMF